MILKHEDLEHVYIMENCKRGILPGFIIDLCNYLAFSSAVDRVVCKLLCSKQGRDCNVSFSGAITRKIKN